VLPREPEGGPSVFVPKLPSVATAARRSRKLKEMIKKEADLEVIHEDDLTDLTVHAA